jgi:hypothetical protein
MILSGVADFSAGRMGVLRSFERGGQVGVALLGCADLPVRLIVCPLCGDEPKGQRRCRDRNGEQPPPAREAERFGGEEAHFVGGG